MIPRACVWLVLSALAGLAAGSLPAVSSSDELVRRANAALRQGDLAAAERLYAAAAELATDPGLVAFNRGAAAFARGDFREAEVLYAQVLADAECPPERAARAWFNRGTALLRRGGTAAVYRSAVACFERCLESPAADAPLRADARFNLELAKLLWDQARRAEGRRDSPNSNPPPEDPDRDPPPSTGRPPPSDPHSGPLDPQTRAGDGPGTPPTPGPDPSATPPPSAASRPAPGGTPHPPDLEDRATLQPLSPEDTRRHLRDIAARLRHDRRALLRTLYGPPQAGIFDW